MDKNYEYFIDKVEGFDSLSQIEQVKYIAYFYSTITKLSWFKSGEIADVFTSEKLIRPSNVTDCLNKLCSKGHSVLIKKGNLYSLHRTAQKTLDEVFFDKKHVREISDTLRSLLNKVNTVEQKLFLEEAIICYEVKTYRAAIIMVWLLTMDVLYEYVVKRNMNKFNSAVAQNNKFKNNPITKKEDFLLLKENDFIMILHSSGLITKDQKKILEEKLGIRNTAAHPNSIVIKESKASNVIEDLVLNIISKFQ